MPIPDYVCMIFGLPTGRYWFHKSKNDNIFQIMICIDDMIRFPKFGKYFQHVAQYEAELLTRNPNYMDTAKSLYWEGDDDDYCMFSVPNWSGLRLMDLASDDFSYMCRADDLIPTIILCGVQLYEGMKFCPPIHKLQDPKHFDERFYIPNIKVKL